MPVELTSALRERREYSQRRLDAVRARLAGTDAKEVLGSAGVVYATGSMARGDASRHSDLDVFILSETIDKRRALSKLDSIRLKARLIEVIAAEELPKFSDDGKYLVVHTIDEMLDKLGKAEDDYENLFTARMLLLLESVFPLDRLLAVSAALSDESVDDSIRSLFSMYESFLETTAAQRDQVRARFGDDKYNSTRRSEAKAFGDEMFTLLNLAGGETELYRYLVI